jgi:thiamine transport system permease protein
VALGFIFTVVAGAFAALGHVALENPLPGGVVDAYTWRIVAFTLWQAALSTVLSLAFAFLAVRSIARQDRFFGRILLLRLFALPLALPALVVVLGVIGVWGRQGWVMEVLRPFGVEFSIFGLTGILLAHVFFNMPLALRLLLARLEAVPVENWRLAAQLDLSPWVVFRLVEWPVLRPALAGVAGLVFMLCLASFAVVLTLGGGPGSTTIEVAIYQALRFDFDPARAVFLALVQLALTVMLLMGLSRFMISAPLNPPLRLSGVRLDGRGVWRRLSDGVVILAAAAFLILPLAALVGDGLAADLGRLLSEIPVLRAAATSLGIAASAALLCHVIAWPLLKAAQARGGRFARFSDLSASAILVMPPVVLGAGWFVLLHRWGSVFSFSALVVIVINALMALPFAYRILAPALAQAARASDRLCASLGIAGFARFRLIDWPMLRRPLALSFGFAMALSLGDLGVIALFGSQDLVTLPLLLLQRMGSYRTLDAAGLALLLGMLCLALVYGSEKLFRGAQSA